MARKNVQNGSRRRNRRGRGGTHSERAVSLPNHVMLKPCYTAPYRFSRTFDIGALPKGASDLGHAFPFALSQVPNSQEFTTLFDRYRIRAIDVRLVYSGVPTSISSGYSTHPTVWAYMDDDDAVIPATKAAVLERQSVRPFTFSDAKTVVSYTINPRWLLDGTNKSSLAPRSMWIDMTTPSVSHYGIKFWVDEYNTSVMHSGMQITMTATLHFECQCVR